MQSTSPMKWRICALQQKISIVVPMYNEEEVIEEIYKRLCAVIQTLPFTFEMIFVNDGSRDATLAHLLPLQKNDDRVKIIDFAKNFSHQIAVTAGLHAAKGDAVLIIDADLQDPPELLPAMITKWQEGYDVVYGKRMEREGETIFKKITASLFYRTMAALTGDALPRDTGDFRLIDRKVVDAIGQMGEHARFMRGMVAWVGFRQVALPYHRPARFAGETKYPLRKMLRLAMDGILSFSTAPLSFLYFIGSIFAAIGLIGLICYGIVSLQNTLDLSLVVLCVTTILAGCLFLGMGILGTYIGRIYEEAKGRPLYLISRTYGFNQDKEGESEI